MTFIVVLTVDRHANMPSSYYPGPRVEVDETIFSDFAIAVQYLRSKLICLGVMEGHLEDENGERVECDVWGF
jgi:hypothetical protein